MSYQYFGVDFVFLLFLSLAEIFNWISFFKKLSFGFGILSVLAAFDFNLVIFSLFVKDWENILSLIKKKHYTIKMNIRYNLLPKSTDIETVTKYKPPCQMGAVEYTDSTSAEE